MSATHARAPRRWKAVAGTFVLAALFSLGWALLQSPGRPARADETAAERAALADRGQELLIPIEDRPTAPPFSLQTVSYADGSVFDLGEEQGNVVALYFMAAWCLTCIPEAEALARLHEAYADRGLRILVIDVDQTETEDDLARFRERAGGGEHLWAFDPGYQVVQPYGVRALDTTIFIDREGRAAYADASPTPYEDLQALAEALLQ